MYTVYWVNQLKHIKEQHGSYDTFEQAMQFIKDLWQEHDYQPPYYRVMRYGKSCMVDYGLCDCFYEIEHTDPLGEE